jgi:hypothetical protein
MRAGAQYLLCPMFQTSHLGSRNRTQRGCSAGNKSLVSLASAHRNALEGPL